MILVSGEKVLRLKVTIILKINGLVLNFCLLAKMNVELKSFLKVFLNFRRKYNLYFRRKFLFFHIEAKHRSHLKL